MRAGTAIRSRFALRLAALAPMVGECGSDAKCKRVSGNGVRFREDDGPIPFECEIAGKERLKYFDPRCLTVEMYRIPVGAGLPPGNANCASTPGLCDVTYAGSPHLRVSSTSPTPSVKAAVRKMSSRSAKSLRCTDAGYASNTLLPAPSLEGFTIYFLWTWSPGALKQISPLSRHFLASVLSLSPLACATVIIT